MNLKKLQILILTIGWSYSIYFAIWAFIVYSTSTPYDTFGYGLAGTFTGGIIKSLNFFLINGLIVLTSTILVFLDNRQTQSFEDRTWNLPDIVRIVLLGFNIFFGLPWLFAIHGIFISDIPGLNLIFLGRQTGILGTNPFDYIYPAVHLGIHHGLDGYLFIMYSLLFSILVFEMKSEIIRYISIFGMGFLASYGLIAYLEDIIHEQIIKRGILPIYWHLIKSFYDFSFLFGFVFAGVILVVGIFYYYNKEK